MLPPIGIYAQGGVSYATWSSANKSSNISLFGNNLTFRGASANQLGTGIATIGKSSGKWYWEVTITVPVSTALGGIVGACSWIPTSSSNVNCWINLQGAGYKPNGVSYCIAKNISGSVVTQGSSCANLANNTVVSFALDMDSGTLKIYLGGTQVGGDVTGLTGTWYPACMSQGVNTTTGGTANFGASAFSGSTAALRTTLSGLGYNMGVFVS